jgi:hypothetical protein
LKVFGTDSADIGRGNLERAIDLLMIKRLPRLVGQMDAAARSGDHLALAAGQARRTSRFIYKLLPACALRSIQALV